MSAEGESRTSVRQVSPIHAQEARMHASHDDLRWIGPEPRADLCLSLSRLFPDDRWSLHRPPCGAGICHGQRIGSPNEWFGSRGRTPAASPCVVEVGPKRAIGNSLLLSGINALHLARKDARHSRSGTRSEHIGYSESAFLSVVSIGSCFSVRCSPLGVTAGGSSAGLHTDQANSQWEHAMEISSSLHTSHPGTD